ncbi:MAG: orotidine-5'-phosphate decarboxylase [Deltaproteobacteria bacterium]
MNAVDKLIEKIKQKNNPTVVGLDPRLDKIPEFIKKDAFKKFGTTEKGAAEAIIEFNKKILDSIYEYVPAVKPQIAFYEIFGEEGIRAFRETCNYAKEKDLLVIGDIKRGDIDSTAEAYSTAYLGKRKIGFKEEGIFDIDFVTVNPYLGADSIKPFVEDCSKYDKGIFVLVKTSNKSSGDIQDILAFGGKFLYEHVAEMVTKWGQQIIGQNGYSAVGAVVGATYPEQISALRAILKHGYILVPGYGAQGGRAGDVVKAFKNDGLGAIVNASRSIIFAYQSDKWKTMYAEDRFDTAARAEVIRMRDELNKELARKMVGRV